MPDVTYSPLEEGDAITAGSVNSRFTGVVSAINDLTTDSVDQFCFNSYHLPSLVVVSGQQWIAGPITYTETTTGIGPGNEITLDSNGEAGGGTDLSITFTAQTLGSGMRGILAMFNCVVNSVTDNTGGTPQWGRMAVFTLQLRDTGGGGTWTTINRTRRMVAERNLTGAGQTQELDVSIQTLIVAGDVPNNIDGVRVRMYMVEDPPVGGAVTQVVISSAQLMVLGVRSD